MESNLEKDIETCVGDTDSTPDQSEEVNFDLMTRYYQILLSHIENGAGELTEISHISNLRSRESSTFIRITAKSRAVSSRVLAIFSHFISTFAIPFNAKRVSNSAE